ncbi:helix-turn-helix transcriptional regulator [Ostreiculturibacter nitratireducens]|uniref:AraC family transcriptional regulator n=1 Tax=Ostreiculturibacter nitratireducens TaxID=3075226 RepID=UPI0031B5AE09
MLSWNLELAIGPENEDVGTLSKRVEDFRLLDPVKGEIRVRSLKLGSVTISTAMSTGYDINSYEPSRSVFATPVAGSMAISTGGCTFDCRSGGAVYLRPGRRESMVRAPSDGYFLGIAVAAPYPGRTEASRRARFFEAAVADPAASSMNGFLQFFVREVSRPGSPLHRPEAQRAAEALFLDFFAQIDAADEDVDSEAPSTLEARVRTAEEVMLARADEALSIADVAAEIGVGMRALQAAFQAVRHSSPRAVLNAYRLDRARERLLMAGPGSRVSDIALDCGFSHFGRFSKSYRQRFGELPSETLHSAVHSEPRRPAAS